MKINKILFFVIPLVIGAVGVGAYFIIAKPNPSQTVQIKIPFVGSQFSLENAPSQSLKAKIVSMSGDVFWTSRVATQEAELKKDTLLQQGEQISTKENGHLAIQFDDKAKVNLLPKTQVDIIQTLENDVVFNQASGSAVYEKTGNYPVSIRVKHLLVENGGQISITINSDNPELIAVEAVSGNSRMAFNDQSNTSNVVILKEENTYIFNDDMRTVELK